MGSGMAKLILNRKGIRIVGAIAQTREKSGRDLGNVLELGKSLSVKVSNDPDEVLSKADADIILHATCSFVDKAFHQIRKAVEHNANVITIAEEMAYPWVKRSDLASEMDKMAKEHNVTILGTGINPGFVLDTLIMVLTGVCAEVNRIKAIRINDLSPYGPSVLKSQGVGTTLDEFNEGSQNGTIVGHVGFLESITMISERLGIKLDKIEESKEAIVSKTYRETPYIKISPGMVAGCKQVAHGYKNGEAIITLEHPQQIHPEVEKIETGDFIWVEGKPSINLSIKPEIAGGTGTIALTVNMIPIVMNAAPGLATMKDLPIPAATLGDISKMVKSRPFL